MADTRLRIAAAQIAPVWLDREATLARVVARIDAAGAQRADCWENWMPLARARHNFDPTGHYSRPDVFRLEVDRTRQRIARFRDDS